MFTRILAALAVLALGGSASAQVSGVATSVSTDSPMVTDYGIGVLAGGGPQGFVSSDATNAADVGGYGSFHAIVGTRWYAAGEINYDYGIQKLTAPSISDTTLHALDLGGNLRLQYPMLASHMYFTPFAFGGLSWTHYARTDLDQDMLGVPAGAGLAWTYKGLLAEARFTYRFAVNPGNVDKLLAVNNATENLDTWSAGLTLGAEL